MRLCPIWIFFGEQVQNAPKRSTAGCPRVALRINVALLYLKHAFDESDESVVAHWADTPRWQFFAGCAYYDDRRPCGATTLVKLRQLLGEEGVEDCWRRPSTWPSNSS